MRRVYLEVYGLSIDAFVVARYTRSLRLNFSLNLSKVPPSPTWDMMKFGPFVLGGNACGGMWYSFFAVGTALWWYVDELQD